MSDSSSKIDVADSSYVHPSAVLEGEVPRGEECCVGAGAILGRFWDQTSAAAWLAGA